MENFVVSARKYRPQDFNSVVGQSHITTTLKNAIKNQQLAHAFLFCGPRGVGKTTCARILAKTINCENRTADDEACDACTSCVSFNKGSSFNIHELDAASNNSVEDMRKLTEQVRFAPQGGKYKVYIVDEVHMLSQAAFNAFLKTLEEPPPYAIFILATTEKHKILPTILSRCQIFDFKRITNDDTVAHLQSICEKESVEAERTALHLIAQKSEGCMRDSLSIMDKIVSFTDGKITYSNTLEHLNILDEDYFFRLLEAMQQQQLSEALLLYNEIDRKGFEGDIVLGGFAEFLRNMLVSKDVKSLMLLEVADGFKDRYHEKAKTIDNGWLLSALNILGEAEIQFKQARNKRLHVEMVFIKLSYLQQALQLVADGEQVVKKKLIDKVKPVAFRALNPVAVKEPSSIAPKTVTKKSFEKKPVSESVVADPAPKLVVQKSTPASGNSDITSSPKTRVQSTMKTQKLGRLNLDAIRNKVKEDNRNSRVLPLEMEELQKAWGLYIQKLEENKNPSAVSNFRSSELSIMNENCIEIIADNVLQQRFIDAERGGLIDHLQEYFNNRQLTYTTTLIEKQTEKKASEKQLSPREQFSKIADTFPMVAELKDRLKLRLD